MKDRIITIRAYPLYRLYHTNCSCGSTLVQGTTYKDDYDYVKYTRYTTEHDVGCSAFDEQHEKGCRALEKGFNEYQISERKAVLTLEQWNKLMNESL